jgi:hypothetical protein
MKRNYAWIAVLMSLALVLGMAGTSMALNSGVHMFTESGNDSNFGIGNLEALIEDWFSTNNYPQYADIDLSFYAKVDEPDTSNGGMSVGYDNDMKSGTWNTDDFVNFYSVKAGNSFAFYWVDPASDSGTWDTSNVFPVGNSNNPNQPEISHVSTWIMAGNGTAPPPAPIPEPSTVFLMGLGLAGMGLVYRKRSEK